MTTLLILEGNPSELVSKGMSDAIPFVSSFTALDPSIRLSLANPYADAISEEEIAAVDGVVFTGSGTEWAADAPEAEPQRVAMRSVFAQGKPVWGSCNGMQVAAVVLGGRVGASPKGAERGMARDVTVTKEGRSHALMAGKGASFASPCTHRDEVQALPEGATLIAGNAHSPVQAFVYEQDGVDFWGVQYHPECGAAEMIQWLSPRGAECAEIVQNFATAETDADAAARLGTSPKELALDERARELRNWLEHVKART
ncbi:type 1 glutamine amidotransferase [Shimia abyssi]|nr:type 1 glutamine amidotransferase [Shimia abyssi]